MKPWNSSKSKRFQLPYLQLPWIPPNWTIFLKPFIPFKPSKSSINCRNDRSFQLRPLQTLQRLHLFGANQGIFFLPAIFFIKTIPNLSELLHQLKCLFSQFFFPSFELWFLGNLFSTPLYWKPFTVIKSTLRWSLKFWKDRKETYKVYNIFFRF